MFWDRYNKARVVHDLKHSVTMELGNVPINQVSLSGILHRTEWTLEQLFCICHPTDSNVLFEFGLNMESAFTFITGPEFPLSLSWNPYYPFFIALVKLGHLR